MKTNQTQSRFGLLRIAGALPVLFGLLCAFPFTSKAATHYAPYEPRPGATPKATQPDENALFFVAEVMPKFQGGDLVTFRQWAHSQIVYPAKAMENCIAGRVVVMFVVEKDGSVSNIKTLLSPDELLAAETRRIIASSPKWMPGTMRGKPVRVTYTLPVDFRIVVDDFPAPEDTITHYTPDWFPEEPADSPFLLAEVMPKFQGGDLATFRQWVQSQIKYPEEALKKKITGRVVLSFIIEKNGKVSNVQILQSPDKSLSDEAVRVVASSPVWTPARHSNQLVRIKYTLPVDFKLPAP